MIHYSENIQSKTSKEKSSTGAKSGGILAQVFKSSLPEESQRMREIATTPVKCGLPGKLIRDSEFTVFNGARISGTLCLAHTRIPDSQKESKSVAETILFVQIVYVQ